MTTKNKKQVVALGTSKRKGKDYNPTTGEAITPEKAASLNAPQKYSIGDFTTTNKAEYEAAKNKAGLGSRGAVESTPEAISAGIEYAKKIRMLEGRQVEQPPLTNKTATETLTATTPEIDTTIDDGKTFQPNLAKTAEEGDIIPLKGMTGAEEASGMVNTLLLGAEGAAGGAIAKGAGVAKKAVQTGGDIISKLVKGTGNQNKVRKILEQEEKIRTMSKRLGTSKANAKRIIEISEGRSLSDTLKALSKPAIWTGAGIIGMDGMATWLASDNIATGTGITANNLVKQAQAGEDPEKIIQNLNELQRMKDLASRFINISTMLNPLLWGFRKSYKLNLEKAQLDLDIARQNIESASSSEAINQRAMTDRKNKAFDIKNREIINNQML